jgi:glycosyltransferase involved in cell wall biosynthesis
LIVGFDVTPLLSRAAGIARHTIELLRAIDEDAPSVDLRLATNRPIGDPRLSDALGGFEWLQAPTFPLRQVWLQAQLPRALARANVDICHFTNFDAPLISRVPSVVTVHDVSLLIAPHMHPARRVLTLAPLMRVAARRAQAVACGTESARREAIRYLHLDPARVHVLGNGVSDEFRLVDEAVVAEACARFGVEPGFVLFIGTIEPRKNLTRLALAFAKLRRDGYDGKLVISGGWGWKSESLRPRIESLGLGDSVVFTGYVPDGDLVALLNGAGAFVYPSLYEGFGLPIIEAFACGAPVITSNRGAMAEVAGDAALLVDPTNVDGIAAAISRALTDESERQRMRAAGLARVAQFNRPAVARRALAMYEAALGA